MLDFAGCKICKCFIHIVVCLCVCIYIYIYMRGTGRRGDRMLHGDV